MDKEFFDKVREGYLQIQKREPERFIVISGIGSPEEIHYKIIQLFNDQLLKLRGL